MIKALFLAAAAALLAPSAEAARGMDFDKMWSVLPRNQTVGSTKLRGTLTSYKSCGSDSDHAKNFVATVTPDAAKPGDSVTTTFDYDLDKEVTGGTATYKVTLNFIPFSPTVDDLCADQAGSTDECPLAGGGAHHHDVSVSTFPNGVSGTIVSTIIWADQDGEQVLCFQWTVKV